MYLIDLESEKISGRGKKRKKKKKRKIHESKKIKEEIEEELCFSLSAPEEAGKFASFPISGHADDPGEWFSPQEGRTDPNWNVMYTPPASTLPLTLRSANPRSSLPLSLPSSLCKPAKDASLFQARERGSLSLSLPLFGISVGDLLLRA